MHLRNYSLRKTCLNKCVKSLVSEDPLTNNMVNRTKHSNLNKITSSRLLNTVKAINLEIICLVICKVLKLFVNTLTAHDKYSLLNKDSLTQPIQMHLSKKEKTFAEFFSEFLKFRISFEYFQKKEDHHSRCISEFTYSGKGG